VEQQQQEQQQQLSRSDAFRAPQNSDLQSFLSEVMQRMQVNQSAEDVENVPVQYRWAV
jgi:hypothetical protein